MKFITYTDKAGKWRWRVIAGNGEIVGASSQGFASRSIAFANAELLGLKLQGLT
jgi:uncharacterized protein YegP (UPF0339 family)